MRIPNDFVDKYIKVLGTKNIHIVLHLMKQCYEYGIEDGSKKVQDEWDKVYE